ncbi:cysteine proteinase [Tricholoma matsutake]|nr:cysteine proteinase [Tricholoma matsutake 945]
MVPQQVKAVIFLFPDDQHFVLERQAEDLRLSKGKQEKLDLSIFWMKQTIGNACGTMALIHAIANSDITITPGSPMFEFLEQCEGKSPAERGHILETTFSNIHAESAGSGQSTVPTDPSIEPPGHFTCFVQIPEAGFRDRASRVSTDGLGVPHEGSLTKTDSDTPTQTSTSTSTSTGMRLVELNGTRGGPIDRGECEDLLRDTAKYVKEMYVAQSPSMCFSMLALVAPDQSTV